jgi:hypothetical protein
MHGFFLRMQLHLTRRILQEEGEKEGEEEGEEEGGGQGLGQEFVC